MVENTFSCSFDWNLSRFLAQKFLIVSNLPVNVEISPDSFEIRTDSSAFVVLKYSIWAF